MQLLVPTRSLDLLSLSSLHFAVLQQQPGQNDQSQCRQGQWMESAAKLETGVPALFSHPQTFCPLPPPSPLGDAASLPGQLKT